MAYVSTAEGYSGFASVIPNDHAPGSVISIPSDDSFAGEFRRAGPDLILVGHDGRRDIIPGYFTSEHRPDLQAPNGFHLSGEIVDILAGSQAPAQYAQAQPTPPPNAIGKVEKVVGEVTAIRNGVSVTLNVGDAVYQQDVVQTGTASVVGISFPDGTALNLVANTRMALNEYSFDPNSSPNGALLTLVQGTFAFVAGKVAHEGEMKISTPVVTMGIRGTTGYVMDTGHSYEFVVVDDYATTRHGAYDLYQIDQSGHLVRDQNGNFIVLGTVSQTQFVTECVLASCTTTPMSAGQAAFAQQIISGVFETYVLANPTVPRTNGDNGSSTPPPAPNLPQLQLIRLNGTQSNGDGTNSSNGPTPTIPTTQQIVIPPPPLPATNGWDTNKLVEYYFYPSLSSVYFTSTTFVAPASGVEANPDRGGLFTLSVSGNSITASGFPAPQFPFDNMFSGADFNGFEIVDLSADPLISGVTIDPITNMVGFDASDISFVSNAVLVNLQGLPFGPGTIIKLDLTFDPPLNPAQLTLAQTLDGSVSPANNAEALTVANGTELALDGIINNTGTIVLDGSSTATAIGIDGHVTLHGGGVIELSNSNENYIFGTAGASLTNLDNTISGSGDIGNGSLVFDNAGTIETHGPYALIIDTGLNAFINTGKLQVDGGSLIIDSPVTGHGNAVIAGGALEFAHASDSNVSFTASGSGYLALDQSQYFTGQISGFAAQDKLDLGDIAFSTATTLSYLTDDDNSGGILKVSDGPHTANLDLIGDYSAASFTLSSDGHGGTMLTVPSSDSVDQNSSTVSSSGMDVTTAEQADGTVAFANFDSIDQVTANFTPTNPDYIGSFSIGPVTEGAGGASVAWKFSLESDQINLAPGASLTQSYDVGVADAHGTTAGQTVAVSIGGVGSDNFLFQPGIGADTIVNFNPQADTIELHGFNDIQSMQQLASLIATDVQGDAVLNLGHGDSITLPGMSPTELHTVLQSAVHLL
jgi:hypothetical protein